MKNTHTHNSACSAAPMLKFETMGDLLMATANGYDVTIFPMGRTWRLMVGEIKTNKMVRVEAYLRKSAAIDAANSHVGIIQ